MVSDSSHFTIFTLTKVDFKFHKTIGGRIGVHITKSQKRKDFPFC